MLSLDPGTGAAQEGVRQHLAEMIRRVEAGRPGGREAESGGEWGGEWGGRCVQTGWEAVDRSLPVLRPDGSRGLARGAVHEWIGLEEPQGQRGDQTWVPPLDLLAHLARRAAREARGEGQGGTQQDRTPIVAWVGRRCWPHPCSQRAVQPTLVDHSIFIDPENTAQRQWAIELCLRSPAVCAVVADASRLSMAESRRLQLAAEAGLRLGGSGFALLTRPAHEASAISAATTRWIVRRAHTPASRCAQPHPRWRVEQRRCKGVVSRTGTGRGMERETAGEMGLEMAGKMGWVLEGGHETGVVCLSPDVVDRSGSQEKHAQSA
jgi:hypothetical protein